MPVNVQHDPPTEAGNADRRRRFLIKLTSLLVLIGTVTLVVPLGRMLFGSALRRRKALWVEVGDVSAVTADAPLGFDYRYVHNDGWITEIKTGQVYVVLDSSGNYVVMSNVCTHAGCAVRWEPEKKGFFCPCHNALYDIHGKVLQGPPPRPLDRLTSRVKGRKLFIEIKDA